MYKGLQSVQITYIISRITEVYKVTLFRRDGV